MDRSGFFYKRFRACFPYDITADQDRLFIDVADFLAGDEHDILVVNGYAGTGKTTAISAVIEALDELRPVSRKDDGPEYEEICVLLAPTGRAAKVLSLYANKPASTIHKCIYRQKSIGSDGFGQFSLAPNKQSHKLFIVDEVSLIGIEDNGRQGTASFGTGDLLKDLVDFVRAGNDCRLILIGDSAQLPPVGLDASPALSPDYMEGFGGVKYSGLKEVVRQQKESGILWNATRIRELITSDPYGGATFTPDEIGLRTEGFDDIKRITGGELLDTLNQAYFTDYSKDDAIVLCRSNKRANRYNAGIRAQVLYDEERLVRGEKLMIVKNCYQFTGGIEGMDYIANGDIAKLVSIKNFEERYGLSFADARLSFPDYDDAEITAKVCLDTLSSEAASLTYEQQNMLYNGVNEDYSHLTTKKKRYEAVREDPYFNALQLKYANAITCHKSQGGQWSCVFVDNPFWQDELTVDDLKWLYTALTRAVEKVYLVNFKGDYFSDK
ncbi:MAG: AAA family ATPase [Bacteroidales bacterium]|nr:AAA family ATPase [Bacteroidales bacterium]